MMIGVTECDGLWGNFLTFIRNPVSQTSYPKWVDNSVSVVFGHQLVGVRVLL